MRPRRLAVALILILLIVGLTSPLWIPSFGQALVHSDPLQHADAILVLGGDYKGERVMAACALVKQGIAPVAYVSGPMGLYGHNEADLAVEFAVKNGCPVGMLQPLYAKAFSTEEEAREFHPLLMKRGVKRLLVVTSNYHTARARRLFRRWMVPDIEVSTYAMPDSQFDPDHWWQSREAQKTVFFEWTKTIAGAVGL